MATSHKDMDWILQWSEQLRADNRCQHLYILKQPESLKTYQSSRKSLREQKEGSVDNIPAELLELLKQDG